MNEAKDRILHDFSRVLSALDELERAAGETSESGGRIYHIPPPNRLAENDSILGGPGTLRAIVVPSEKPLNDAIVAWCSTTRAPEHHARYVDRWAGIILLPAVMAPYVLAVNRAKMDLQETIDEVLPVLQYNTAQRMMRSRFLSDILPINSDRRLIYRHIPVEMPDTGFLPYDRAYLYWRRVTSNRRMALADVKRLIESAPVPRGRTMQEHSEWQGDMYNWFLSAVNDGRQIIERFEKPPTPTLSFRDSEAGTIAKTVPLSLPLVVFAEDLAIDVEAFLSTCTLDDFTPSDDAHEPRKRRAELQKYMATGLKNIFLKT